MPRPGCVAGVVGGPEDEVDGEAPTGGASVNCGYASYHGETEGPLTEWLQCVHSNRTLVGTGAVARIHGPRVPTSAFEGKTAAAGSLHCIPHIDTRFRRAVTLGHHLVSRRETGVARGCLF